MAFQPNVDLINPSVLAAVTRSARTLTETEMGQLRAELAADPNSLGYQVKGDGATQGQLLPSHEVAGLLNTSGRAQELFPGLVMEAADILQAVAATPATGGAAQNQAGPAAAAKTALDNKPAPVNQAADKQAVQAE